MLGGLGGQGPAGAHAKLASRRIVGGPWDLATLTLSRPEQATDWANRGNEYTEMKLQQRSTILDGSPEPVIVPNDGV